MTSGLVEGCAPLTKQDKATVSGCSRRFTLKDRKEWVPDTTFPVDHDDFLRADIAVFYVTLGSLFDVGNQAEDVAVVRLLGRDLYRKKMYTVKIWREGGKIALYESRITRNFFFSNENDREVAVYGERGWVDVADVTTAALQLTLGHCGAWRRTMWGSGCSTDTRRGTADRCSTVQYSAVQYSAVQYNCHHTITITRSASALTAPPSALTTPSCAGRTPAPRPSRQSR